MSGFFQRLVTPCPTCGGTGCPDCSGGWVDLPVTDECHCRGRGWFYSVRDVGMEGGPRKRIECSRCAGTGVGRPSLAAWAIPGDTVHWFDRHGDRDGLWYEAVVLSLTIDRVEVLLDDGFDPECEITDLKRVVSTADEARRAALHPSFAYPLETL